MCQLARNSTFFNTHVCNYSACFACNLTWTVHSHFFQSIWSTSGGSSRNSSSHRKPLLGYMCWGHLRSGKGREIESVKVVAVMLAIDWLTDMFDDDGSASYQCRMTLTAASLDAAVAVKSLSLMILHHGESRGHSPALTQNHQTLKLILHQYFYFLSSSQL